MYMILCQSPYILEVRFTVIRGNGTITFHVDSGLVCGRAYKMTMPCINMQIHMQA